VPPTEDRGHVTELSPGVERAGTEIELTTDGLDCVQTVHAQCKRAVSRSELASNVLHVG